MAIRITPKGIARYPFLNTPFTKFDPEGIYKITLALDLSDPDSKKFCSAVSQKVKSLGYTTDKSNPVKMIDALHAEVKFHSKYKPQVFDSQKQPMNETLQVGEGSSVRVAFESSEYKNDGGGLTFYLKAVQVVDFVPYNGPTGDSYGFKSDEEGFVAPANDFVVEENVSEQTTEAPDSENDGLGQW